MTETKPKRRWFSFSIRELLLLTAIAALAIGWWLEWHSTDSWKSIRSKDGSVMLFNRSTGERIFLR